MAYCKIHPIRADIESAVEYICDSEKTEDKIWITAHECAPETAALEFAFSLSGARSSGPIKGYHLIQSFLPGEADPETAHKIGTELASRILGDDFSYIVATHTNRDHMHNHIIFCAADNVQHRKYHDCKQSYYHIRNVSDELCEQYGLSVIKDYKSQGKTYKEWIEEKRKKSWKTAVRNDIDSAVRKAITYDDFLRIMKDMGYGIKGEELNVKTPKYISFLPPGKDRWVRGKTATLGEEFTRERIAERITENSQTKSAESLLEDNAKLITLSEETLKNKPYLKQWASRKNLQAAAEIYTQIRRAGYDSLEDALEHLAASKQQSKDAHTLASDLDKKMRPMAKIIRYAEQYQANLPYKQRYEKSKNPEKYFQSHETEISLCDGAAYLLKKEGIEPDNIDLNSLRSGYAEMNEQKQNALKEYNAVKEDIKKLEKLTDTLERYLEREERGQVRSGGNESLA